MKDKFLYFSDTAEGPIQLHMNGAIMSNAEFAQKFPGVKGVKYDSFSKQVGYVGREVFPVTRVIRFKKCPSLHVCNAKCMGGKIDGTCECSCGGKNHGRAGFTMSA